LALNWEKSPRKDPTGTGVGENGQPLKSFLTGNPGGRKLEWLEEREIGPNPSLNQVRIPPRMGNREPKEPKSLIQK